MVNRFTLIRIISKIHGLIYHLSKGRIGKDVGSVEILLLTTKGSRSGKKRTVPLTAIPYGENYILVASFGGSPLHPAWLINIQHNPLVDIRVGSTVRKAEASIIETTDARYGGLWEKAIATYAGYDDYKQATARHIPLAVITPERV